MYSDRPSTVILLALLLAPVLAANSAEQDSIEITPESAGAFFTQYCNTCHNQYAKIGDVVLDTKDLEHVAETQPEVRSGDAVAFSAPDHEGEEMCVLMVQCRELDPQIRNNLVRRLTALVRMEMSLDCYVQLVPNRALPRTSSGKLSRANSSIVASASPELYPGAAPPLISAARNML